LLSGLGRNQEWFPLKMELEGMGKGEIGLRRLNPHFFHSIRIGMYGQPGSLTGALIQAE
jgi:hypothetical protein